VQNPLKVKVATQRNPTKMKAEALYRVTVTNTGTESQKQVQLTVTIPENMVFVNVLKSPAASTIDGQKLQFSTIQEFRAREAQDFDIVLRAVRPGSAKVVAEVTSLNQPEPASGSEVANVVD
jgi:hypothetical protein